MLKKKLVIFDWDGTIEDSILLIICSMKQAASTIGFSEPSENDIRDIIGLSLWNAVSILFPNSTKLEQESFINIYKARYKSAQQIQFRLFENVGVTLERLKKKNYVLAIATGKSRDGLNRSLHMTGLTNLFDGSRTADETASKPDPQMVLELLKQLNIAPTNALMIGDSKHDLEMAQNASIASIGATYGVHDKTILAKHLPIGFARDFEEILLLVDRHFAEKN